MWASALVRLVPPPVPSTAYASRIAKCRRRNQLLLEALLPREMITGLHKQHAAAHLGPRSQCMGKLGADAVQ